MPMETYRFEVRETETGEGIDASLYDEDDLVEASTRVTYEEYGLDPDDGREEPTPEVREVRTDATRTDVQFERDPAGFEFRVIGGGEDLATARVDDEEWGLAES